MRMARAALAHAALDLARRAVKIAAGDVIFDRVLLDAAPEETLFRLVAHALCWVASADYRPRFLALTAAYAAASQGRRTTLHGCLLIPKSREIRVTREAASVAAEQTEVTSLWDNRWRLSGPDTADATIRALGAPGLAQCPDWRATGYPRASLLASPSVWAGDRLISAPLAGKAAGWSADLHKGAADFFTSLIVH